MTAFYRSGIGYGVASYLCWGFLPLFFSQLHGIPTPEVLAHRIIWSLVLLAGMLLALKRTAVVHATLRGQRLTRTLLPTAVLLGMHWLIYIWAVSAGRVIETSLGSFILPLLNVAMGAVFLRERPRSLQSIAVGLAGIGVVVLAFLQNTPPWIALSLAVTFASYTLLRKLSPIDTITGLFIETALLTPLALAYLLWTHSIGGFGANLNSSFLLMASGLATAVPLLLFTVAAKRLPLITMGLLQYLSPTIQFIIAITVFDEELTLAYGLTFAFIWLGQALYMHDLYRSIRT